MKTIFLASGKSSRMEPLSDKNQLHFYGKPLCIHLMERAKKGGATSFIVVTNGKNTQDIKEAMQKWDISGAVITQQEMDLGMAGGISDGLLKCNPDDPVLIIGGNDAIDSSAYSSVIQAINNGDDGAILAKQVETYFPGGYLSVTKTNKIIGIIEKPGEGNEPSDLVNIVCHCFKKAGDLLKALENASSNTDDVYEVALDYLFKNGTYTAVPYKKPWQAIKFPWHVLDMKDVLKRPGFIHPKSTIHPTALIGDDVYIDEGVQVHPYSVINGTTYIGKNSIIGNGCLIRNSHIEANCVIGFNSEIARSYLSNNVSTHIAYVGDSVVDQDVNFGAYSCTANLRLDKRHIRVDIKGKKITSHRNKLGAIIGKGAQVGVHASLMPGVKIKCGAFVHPNGVYPPLKKKV